MNLDSNYLFASMIWGAVGVGYFIYGKKQKSMAALGGGALMIGASYFFPNVLLMSLVCVGLMAAVYLLPKDSD